MKFIILTAEQAQQVFTNSLRPREVALGKWILPLAIFTDALHEAQWPYLQTLPQEEVIVTWSDYYLVFPNEAAFQAARAAWDMQGQLKDVGPHQGSYVALIRMVSGYGVPAAFGAYKTAWPENPPATFPGPNGVAMP